VAAVSEISRRIGGRPRHRSTTRRQKYSYILEKQFRWENWAAPKDKDGKIDHNKALTGDDLVDFVNQK
jgi:hypothetical protein